MRQHRIYVNQTLEVGQMVALSGEAFGHLVRVLRAQSGQPLCLFNGDGARYLATISNINKKELLAQISEKVIVETESPLKIHLVQAISRGDKMDLTIQKAVELGVDRISPMFSERCGVKLKSDRLAKKQAHWQKVIESACEQSGRDILPTLHDPVDYDYFLESIASESCLILHPHKGVSIKTLSGSSSFSLVIGPEGGLTEDEVEKAIKAGCQAICLGPRVLRTETAGLVTIGLLQGLFGDF